LTSSRDTPGSSASTIHASSVSSMSTGGEKKRAVGQRRAREDALEQLGGRLLELFELAERLAPAPHAGPGGLTPSHGQCHG
jgi:predicted component of type VI protein secretion system